MVNLLLKIFWCRHTQTKEGFQTATRVDKPIVIDYKECLDCGRILRCKVSFQEEPRPVVPSVAMAPTHITLATDNKDVVTGVLHVAPTVELKMDLTETPKVVKLPPPIKEKPVEPSPIIGPIPPKELALQGLKPEEPKTPAPLVDADQVETVLEKDREEGPFTPNADTVTPTPNGAPVEPSDVDETVDGELHDQSKDAMVEGQCFLKESRGSIAQRRRRLAKRREKALEALKKTGKATIKVSKKSSIPFLDSPDTGSREDETQ